MWSLPLEYTTQTMVLSKWGNALQASVPFSPTGLRFLSQSYFSVLVRPYYRPSPDERTCLKFAMNLDYFLR